MEIDSTASLHCAQGDVECCFYQFGLPRWLHAFFALPQILLRDLPSWLQKELRQEDPMGLGADSVVTFLLTVVPMGWSWAVWMIQTTMEHLIGKSSDSVVSLALYQGAPKVDLTVDAQIIYIDNFASITVCSERSEQGLACMLARLEDAGVLAGPELPGLPLLGFGISACGVVGCPRPPSSGGQHSRSGRLRRGAGWSAAYR